MNTTRRRFTTISRSCLNEPSLSVLSAKVNSLGGFHSRLPVGVARCSDQIKRLESTDDLHLLQVSGSVSCSRLLHCSSPLHGHAIQPRECPASPCRFCSVEGPTAVIFRTLTGVLIDMAIKIAACVVVHGDCCVETLAFKDAEAVKPTCEDLRRL